MRLSFCTNCMGRRSQVEQTLPRNLELLRSFPSFDLVLVDYNSPDGFGEWVRSTFEDEIRAGTLKLFRTTEPKGYVMTHAKNVAHLLSSSDVVTNLDGDNFLTVPYLRFLDNVFRNGAGRLFVALNGPGIGSRISLLKSEFVAAGGYNEELGIGWGPDDFDIALRLHHLGMRRVGTLNIGMLGEALTHADEQRNEHTPQKLPKMETHRRNLGLIIENAKAGRYVANEGKRWGEVTVEGTDGVRFRIYAENGLIIREA